MARPEHASMGRAATLAVAAEQRVRQVAAACATRSNVSAVLSAWFGLHGQHSSHAAIAAKQGISRQRVQQIVALALEHAPPPSNALFARCRRFLSAYREVLDLDVTAREARLRHILGTMSLPGAINLAASMGLVIPQPPPKQVAGLRNDRFDPIRSSLQSLARVNFAISLAHLAGACALESGAALSATTLRRMLEELDVVWLDDQRTWFFYPSDNCAAALRVRKILGAAIKGVEAASIADGMYRDMSFMDDLAHGAVVPPPPVLLRGIECFPWARVARGSAFAVDRASLLSSLPDVERAIVDAASASGGVAAVSDLKNAMASLVTPAVAALRILRVPFLRPLTYGVVQLRGWPLDLHALQVAKDRVRLSEVAAR